MPFRQRIARALEAGVPAAAPLARVWAPIAARTLTRPLRRGVSIPVVCVGGATLGGSGKTRVALAIARELRRRGARVVLVGHGYRGRVREACVVPRDGALATFGDEAIHCARSFDGETIVGPRQAALNLAASRADAIVLDGPLRVPGPRVLSVLAVDADAPWGSGAVVPAGDLRAPVDALLRVADHVVRVSADPGLPPDLPAEIGLFTAIARPQRLVLALARRGIHPRPIVSIADHGPLDRPLHGTWLATEKCALHLEGLPVCVLVLTSTVALPPELTVRLGEVVEGKITSTP